MSNTDDQIPNATVHNPKAAFFNIGDSTADLIGHRTHCLQTDELVDA